MSCVTVKYWKKIEQTRFEPFAATKTGVNRFMSDSESWCKECKAVVDTEGKLDATGITNVCPWCGNETKEKI